MALQKQKVALPITDGIDTKGDDKVELPTRFTALENVVFTKPGTLSKRFGLTSLPNVTSTGGTVTEGMAISELNDSLVLMNSNKLYSYSDSLDLISDRGVLATVTPSELPIASSKSNILFTNSYVHTNGIAVITYVISSEDCRVIVMDVASKTKLAEFNLYDTGVTASGPGPAYVSFLNNKFVIIWSRSDGTFVASQLRYWTIDANNPIAISTSTLIKAYTRTINPNAPDYGVTFVNNCLVAYGFTPSQLFVFKITSAFVITEYSIGTGGSVVFPTIAKITSTKAQVTWSERTVFAGNYTFYNGFNTFSLDTVTNVTVNGAGGGSNLVVDVFSCYNPISGGTFVVYTNYGSAPIATTTNYYNTILPTIYCADYQDGATTRTDNYRPSYTGVIPVSNPFYLNGNFFIYAQSNPLPTYTNFYYTASPSSSRKPITSVYLFKITTDGWYPVSSFGIDSSIYRDKVSKESLDLYSDRATMYLSYLKIAEPNPELETTIKAPTNVSLISLDFSANTNFIDAKAADSLHISGGVLSQFDGNKVVEHGFLQTPPQMYITHTTGGGNLSAGTYQYAYCLSWTDSTGKVHRGPLSIATAHVTSNNDTVTAKYAALYVTSKTKYSYEIYRTTANGTIFYKLTSQLYSGTVVAGYTYTDTMADTALVYLEPLYTNGGILDNDAAYPCNFITTYRNRLFTILTDGLTLQYSKTIGSESPVEFSNAFTIDLDPKGGKATALISLSDTLIVFKERAIFAMNGEGPNDAGEQSDYRAPYLLTSDCGCIDKNSVVEIPEGVMFKGQKGIYLLKRNFGLQYIGDSVEVYNDYSVVSATLLSRFNQARLILSNGTALVYDYYTNRWGVFTGYTSVDSIDVASSYYLFLSDGTIKKETLGSYADNSTFVPMRIKTAWFQLGGVQGFQRIYKILLMGTFKSNHDFTVRIYTDFNEDVYDAVTVNAATGQADGDLWQYKIFTKHQKCQSMMIEIVDVQNGPTGASFELSHIELEVGIKEGTHKVVAGKAAGVS